MAAIFEKAVPLLIVAEGGEEDHVSDYGGKTKYGISQRSFPNVNIDDLTEEQALGLLKTKYWDFYHLSDISDQNIANQAFLLFVNMDPVDASSIIQKAVNGAGRTIIRVDVDGVLGTATFQAINSLTPYWLSDRIRLESCRYYLKLVDDDRSQEVNFRGWIRRALR